MNDLAGCAAPARTVPVRGLNRAAFAGIDEAFARAVAEQRSGGAALSIVHDGETVVDLVGGDYADDSLQLLFSISKALTAIAAAHAHERGALDLDRPLAAVWPELDKASTRSITSRMVLSHRSGLASLERTLSMEEALAGVDDEAIGSQEPYWEPGTDHGYHAFTFGTLLNGVFRRTLGVSVGEYLAERITRPLGLDVWIGAPEEAIPRIQPIAYAEPRISPSRAVHLSASTIPAGTTAQLARVQDVYNDQRIYRADWPSSSGVGSARSLAALFAAVLDGRVLSDGARKSMTAERSHGRDRVLGFITAFGSGMQLPFPTFPMTGSSSFGHEAAGGSVVFADPDSALSVAFTTSVHPPMAGSSAGALGLMSSIRHYLVEAAVASR